MFITAFTTSRHLPLSWAREIQSLNPHPTLCRSFLLLSSDLHLGLPRGLFPSSFPTKIVYAPLLSPMHTTCPTHLNFLDLATRIIFGEQYRSCSFSPCQAPLPGPSQTQTRLHPLYRVTMWCNRIGRHLPCRLVAVVPRCFFRLNKVFQNCWEVESISVQLQGGNVEKQAKFCALRARPNSKRVTIVQV